MDKKRHQTEEYKKYQKEYRKKHREKQKQYMKEYYAKNKKELLKKNKENYDKEKTREYNKQYREKNKEKIKKAKKEYYQKNKERINKKRKDNINKSEVNKVKERIRCLIKNYFRTKGHKKTSKTYKIVGCTGMELYCHLVRTFEERYGIKWEEYYLPKVHIDHKKPISLADSLDEFIELNHYSNLQFLWAVDNMKKGNSYEEE
jgi:hypothetical protein